MSAAQSTAAGACLVPSSPCRGRRLKREHGQPLPPLQSPPPGPARSGNPPPPPPPASFRGLVLGGAPGEMGLGDLRARAADLRRTLDDVARALAYRPDALTW